MEENKNLTAERSLEIIRESIERSQRAISKNSGLPLTWWGVCVFVFALLIEYLWKNHGGPAWNFLWFVMWVIGYIGDRVIDKKKETVPTTFVGKTIGHVWGTFGIFCGGIGLLLGLIGCGVIPVKCVVPDANVYYEYHEHHLIVLWYRIDYHGSRSSEPSHSGLRLGGRFRRFLRCSALPHAADVCDGCCGPGRPHHSWSYHSFPEQQVREARLMITCIMATVTIIGFIAHMVIGSRK